MDFKTHYRSDLNKILNELKDDKQVYTHYFEFISVNGNRQWQFVGKENRPHLRKCLRTLEADGLVENINLGCNIHQWKITEKGKNLIFSL